MSVKLNWLLRSTSPGMLITQAWLSKNGVSPQLARKYQLGDWITKLGSGLYFRTGQNCEWHDAMFCAEKQLQLNLHLSGLSSLIHQGKVHYLQRREEVVWLGVESKEKLPKWFKAFPQILKSQPQKAKLQWKLFSTTKYRLEPSDFLRLELRGTTLKASKPELAALEIAQATPRHLSFEHCVELFQGLSNLSPKKLSSLLGRTRDVKAKRLLLFFGHHFNHPWIKKLEGGKFDLGSGNRQIVRNGKLSKKYKVTVPENYFENQN